jgi:osmotically-inducible protein OsmY
MTDAIVPETRPDCIRDISEWMQSDRSRPAASADGGVAARAAVTAHRLKTASRRNFRNLSALAPMQRTAVRPDHRNNHRERSPTMSSNDLERYVSAELHWDPKIDDSGIAVSADDGVVTLRGTIGSFREKRDAKKDAQRVYGVTSVKNELEVRILTKDRRADADLRRDVLQALMLDSMVPSTVDAKVDDGRVSLTGTAHWRFQTDEAESVAANVRGVISVENDVDLVPPGPSAHDVQHSIKKAMVRNAKLDADSVTVESENGTVTLRGTVSSWADHDQAVDAAWAAPGVTRVKDHILVAY